MNFSSICCRFFLVTINLIVLIFGVLIIVNGTTAIINYKENTESVKQVSESQNHTSDAPDTAPSYKVLIIVLVYGVALSLLCLLAICGSCCGNSCKTALLLFAFFQGLIILAEITWFVLVLIGIVKLWIANPIEGQKIVQEITPAVGIVFSVLLVLEVLQVIGALIIFSEDEPAEKIRPE
ncbi:hypothetical protein PoB_003937000 [Plakobranchus ocellatus]|uniref:Tetraspanin family protein n=1 Tax=Plakobranchus ocellatus TaxID=259542 RepID=A0AAV4AWX3_9GAST|nr:hypothetical protein PoB_003937000 [Plakobranchus ocellatus]